MQSEWRDIAGYEGIYQISNLGQIKIVRTGNIKVITVNKKTGYQRVGLWNKGIVKMASVHRIVAKAFIQNPLNKPDVNHKNKIRTDNKVENLEWVTKSENQKHSYKTIDVRGEKHRRFSVYDVEVNKIREIYKEGNLNQYDIAEIFGVTQSYISNVVNNKRRASSWPR